VLWEVEEKKMADTAATAIALPSSKDGICPPCSVTMSSSHMLSDESMQIDDDDSSSSSSSSSSSDLARLLKALACDYCKFWVHPQCDGLTDEQYALALEGKLLELRDGYMCMSCRPSLTLKFLREKLEPLDQLYLFAEPVTDEQAPTYRDIVTEPVDLLTMSQRATRGEYRSFQMLRRDAELMVHNALLFNKNGDRCWREARRFFKSLTKLFSEELPKTTPSEWGAGITAGIQKELLQKRMAKQATAAVVLEGSADELQQQLNSSNSTNALGVVNGASSSLSEKDGGAIGAGSSSSVSLAEKIAGPNDKNSHLSGELSLAQPVLDGQQSEDMLLDLETYVRKDMIVGDMLSHPPCPPGRLRFLDSHLLLRFEANISRTIACGYYLALPHLRQSLRSPPYKAYNDTTHGLRGNHL
tara:strand:- start:406 stop:1647 length:1242 start_codon:yes stop_codon:yes gene_type:complete